MDAKAKVVWPDNRVNLPDPHDPDARIVGFRIRPGDAWYGLGLSDPLFALRDAVDAAKAAEQALTDHEAAMAEERELRMSLESSWQQAEEQVFELIEKHAILLTGLEALAGECDGIEGLGSAVIAQRIRTLTNPANSENNEVLKS